MPDPAPMAPPVTAPALRRALIAGARRVIAGRDGSTASTCSRWPTATPATTWPRRWAACWTARCSQRSRHVGELLQRVGDDAIDGARGNSGAILAQFLHGVAGHARHASVLDAATLAAAVRQGAASARAGAGQAGGRHHPERDRRLRRARWTTATRPPAMPACRLRRCPARRPPRTGGHAAAAGRAAAGRRGGCRGAGLCRPAGGHRRVHRRRAAGAAHACRAAAGQRAAPLPVGDGTDEDHLHAAHEVDPARRWCTECLVLGGDGPWTAMRLRAALEALGADSWSWPAARRACACMRTSTAAAAVRCLRGAWARGGDEGRRHAAAAAQCAASRRRVAVVTDSAADLPEAIAERYAIARGAGAGGPGRARLPGPGRACRRPSSTGA